MSEDRSLPAAVWMNVADLRLNDNNPRTIKDPRFEKLVNSIKEFPQMLEIRPIVVNADFIILGGNMRYRAAREAGLTRLPVVIAADLTEAQQFEFIIKDNVGYGDWDFDALANDWSELPLSDWGLDLPVQLEEADNDKPIADKVWKLEVIATSEDDQHVIYEKLQEAGYDVRKK